jgi:hypothetical protein
MAWAILLVEFSPEVEAPRVEVDDVVVGAHLVLDGALSGRLATEDAGMAVQ